MDGCFVDRVPKKRIFIKKIGKTFEKIQKNFTKKKLEKQFGKKIK